MGRLSADKPANEGRSLEGDAGAISGVFATVGSWPYGSAEGARRGVRVYWRREGEYDGPDAALGDAPGSETSHFCVMWCMLRSGEDEDDDSADSLTDGTDGVICIARLSRRKCFTTGSGNTATPTG